MHSIILIAHNLRSAHNVGSLLRTADGLGVDRVYLTGYTPYPVSSKDSRLPHLAKKIDKQIAKTALGAEKSVKWQHLEDVYEVIKLLGRKDYSIVALEQNTTAIQLQDFTQPDKLALIIGREVEGIETEILKLCDTIVEIPMAGQKESFNVVVAAAIFLGYCRFS